MAKKVLIISTSLRGGSNSDILARECERGAKEAGHEVEYISLKGKEIMDAKYRSNHLLSHYVKLSQIFVMKNTVIWQKTFLKEGEDMEIMFSYQRNLNGLLITL